MTDEFFSQRPVTRNLDVFDMRLNGWSNSVELPVIWGADLLIVTSL